MRTLLLVALLAAGPALAAAPSPDAVSRKDQGDARRDAGDATGALAAYREALQASPDYIEAWEEIGKLYYGAKRFGEAAEAFQRAVEIDASYSNNWFNLALSRRRAGELPRARDAYRRYLTLKPDDADARLKLAEVLRALEDREAAIREYEAVVNAADNRAVAPNLGDRAREAIAQLRAGAAAPTPTTAPVAPTPTAPRHVTIVQLAPTPTEAPPAALPPPVATAPAPVATAPAPVATVPAQPPAPRPEPVTPPSPAVLDKLALGEKLLASGDYRGALFAFQDAVYLEPRNATARVKLGRAYWNLRYVGQADEQWLQAMQLAPNDPSIGNMIEEARKAPRPAVPEPAGAAAPPAATGPSAPPDAPRVYRYVPEGQGAPAAQPPQVARVPGSPAGSTPGYGLPPAQPSAGYPPAQPGYPPQQGYPQAVHPAPQPGGYPAQAQGGYAAPQPASSYPQQGYEPPAAGYGQPSHASPAPQPTVTQPLYPPPPYEQRALPQQYAPPAPAQAPSAAAAAAAQRYRTALSLYIQRDYLGAIAELDAAITLDPNLSVAYTARGSAKFGLRKYRDAAADYKAALDLDATKAEPIWGLAECQRMLGDPAAVDTYRRYAASIAGDVNEDRRSKARRWATELAGRAP